MMGSRRNGTLYTGSTVDLLGRATEHREKLLPGFTSRHDVTRLVWFEAHESIAGAAERERQIKRWRRAWKIALIEKNNPLWRDLYDELRELE